jgi:hypothetical protein
VEIEMQMSANFIDIPNKPFDRHEEWSFVNPPLTKVAFVLSRIKLHGEAKIVLLRNKQNKLDLHIFDATCYTHGWYMYENKLTKNSSYHSIDNENCYMETIFKGCLFLKHFNEYDLTDDNKLFLKTLKELLEN